MENTDIDNTALVNSLIRNVTHAEMSVENSQTGYNELAES